MKQYQAMWRGGVVAATIALSACGSGSSATSAGTGGHGSSGASTASTSSSGSTSGTGSTSTTGSTSSTGGPQGDGWTLGQNPFCTEVTTNDNCYMSPSAYEVDVHSMCPGSDVLGFHFPQNGAPTTGTFDVLPVKTGIQWSGGPALGHVYLSVSHFVAGTNGEEWFGKSGTVTVTTVNGKPHMAFSNVVMQVVDCPAGFDPHPYCDNGTCCPPGKQCGDAACSMTGQTTSEAPLVGSAYCP